MFSKLAVIRGAGDLATGIACRLYRSGFRRIVLLEIEQPTVIRRTVSYGDAVYRGEVVVEGIKAVKVDGINELEGQWQLGHIPVLIDEKCHCLESLEVDILVDAILAKVNLGTSMAMAPITIGVGPGFTAGIDVHRVVESSRGHDLGRVIEKGSAKANTGVPGTIGGYSKERVIKSPAEGIFHDTLSIGTMVKANDIIGYIDDIPVITEIDGVLRGILMEGHPVSLGMKIGDVDPRGNYDACFTISDKARAIGGGVLEGILGMLSSKEDKDKHDDRMYSVGCR